MGICERYLGWVLFVTTLIIIWLRRKFVTKRDRETAAEKHRREMLDYGPPW
jgi:hypothetical protein